MSMTLVLTSLGFAVSMLCAGVMGFAIQRGATCTVAAVDEVVGKRGGRRLIALMEASLWVAGGLLIAQALHALHAMPGGYPICWPTIAGGALLGLGAYVNRACVFGAIARLGAGEWAYLATPLGFYAGCVTVSRVFPFMASQQLPYGSPVLAAPSWLAAPVLLLMLTRLVWGWRANDGVERTEWARLKHALTQRIWSPHSATTVIGIAFVVMLLLVGSWAYTDVLAELARGMSSNLAARGMLLLALLAGAVLGGWTAGLLHRVDITLRQALQCFVGGLLMGWGSLLIPGGNDGLILVGIPLLWPYAWLAFFVMCVTIGVAQWLHTARIPAIRSPKGTLR